MKRKRIKKICIVFAIIVSVAAMAAAQSIRGVDFKNFSYEVDYCGQEDSNKKITVRDGSFYLETVSEDIPERMYFSISVEAYGDLDGDGSEEAVVTSLCNTGGTGNFTEAYIFGMRDGVPKRLLTIVGGDRAYGGIREARISDGLLEIDTNDAGETGGACCPEFVVTSTYRLTGKTLVEARMEKRRELYPASVIEFARGKYDAVVRVKFGTDDPIKRFSVFASKGQTLTVTKAVDKSYIRLFEGDAEVLTEGASLVAKLNETGRYVFELSGDGNDELEFDITVTIK